ncbi:MAG: hypothetical protein R3Y19_01870 [Rikenellaceae bacterium]
MVDSTKHISSVLQYLNDNVEYALLRNFENLPHDNSGRDIDIIIPIGEFRKHRKAIIQTLTQDQWSIFSYHHDSRMTTFICAKIMADYVEFVQWDFFFDTSIHGIRLLSAQKMTDSRQFNGVLYHVSKEYEFLDKYLYCKVVGAAYPEKYKKTRDLVEHSEIVESELKRNFGCNNTFETDRISGKKLLLRSLWGNLKRSPIRTPFRLLRSIFIYLQPFFRSNNTPTISFTGADGAGKTTIIELFKDKTSRLYGKATINFHFRPTLIPNLGEVAHRSKFKKEVDQEYEKPHRSHMKGVLSSFFRLFYYTWDYLIGYVLRVKKHSRRMVIFDRYYTDMIVDSRRSSIYLSSKFLYYWGRMFIPRMRYNFLITAHPDIILSRKQELDRKAIEKINSKMELLAKKKGYYLIENNSTAQEAVIEILSLIIEKQHKRNMKRL